MNEIRPLRDTMLRSIFITAGQDVVGYCREWFDDEGSMFDVDTAMVYDDYHNSDNGLFRVCFEI